MTDLCYQLAKANLPDDATEEQIKEFAEAIQGFVDGYLGGLQG